MPKGFENAVFNGNIFDRYNGRYACRDIGLRIADAYWHYARSALVFQHHQCGPNDSFFVVGYNRGHAIGRILSFNRTFKIQSR